MPNFDPETIIGKNRFINDPKTNQRNANYYLKQVSPK